MGKQLEFKSVTVLLAVGIVLLTLAPVAVALPPPSVRVIRAVLTDDGDHDGWADTRETVQMRIEVRNLTGVDLTGVVALLETDDPKIAAIPDNRITIGSLSRGETRLSDEAFTFVVGDIERTSPEEELSVTFRVRTYSDTYTTLPDKGPYEDVPFEPQWNEVTLDLDLDVSGGAGPTIFFEGFESGFGSFTTMHIDETLNPPPGDLNNSALGTAASDGYRCQYTDPDWERSSTYNSPGGDTCYPTPLGGPDAYYWHVVNERAFSGQQSLHYGVLLDLSRLYTVPRGNLEAIRSKDPFNLGWANVCSLTRTTFCASADDCPSDEECAPAAPQFTFKHQISLIDNRSINSVDRSADRGMVGVQLAAQDGAPMGDWMRLEPYVNVYDTQAVSNYFGCTFDPVDDGNTEEDYFDPTDPARSLGPSSTCSPHFNFTFQGSTVGSDTTQVGKASESPGLLGAKGPGVWVEPRFDLTRFRGRRLRVRYLMTDRRSGSATLWHPGFVNNTPANPDPRDDGWFVDDVRVTDALTSAATVAADAKDNSGLPGAGEDGDDVLPDNCATVFNPDQEDADADGVGDPCDTCPYDFFDDRDGDGSCCPALADGSDDADGDGLCGTADECPDVFDGGGNTYRLVPDAFNFKFRQSGSSLVGTSGDGLFTVSAGGGAPLVLDADANGSWEFTADGSRIVYGADPNLGLRSVPVEGGPVLQLVEAGDIRRILPGADGSRVVYADWSASTFVSVLFSVPLDGGTPVQLSGASHDVEDVVLTPDAAQVVYTTPGFNADELYSVPATGGTPLRLNPTPGLIRGLEMVADGSRVVYRAVEQGYELFSVPVGGGTVTQLNPALVANGSLMSFVLASDGTRAVYLADQDVDESFELYSVPVSGGAATRLNGALVAGGDVDSYVVTPDPAHVLYRADEETDGAFELHAVPLTGGTPARLAPGMSLSSTTIAVTPDSARAVFAAHDGGSVGLFSVAIAGGPPVFLTESFAEPRIAISGDSAFVATIGPAGLQVVPITGGAPAVLSRPFMPWDVTRDIALSPDLGYVVYVDPDTTFGPGGLFSASLAPDDGDGVPAACDCDDANALVSDAAAPEINDGMDNDCPGEPGYGLIDEVGECTASSGTGFSFDAQQGATSYEVVRAMAADFSVDCTSFTITDPWWEDPDVPPAGSTYFYLVRALTPHAGSWGVDSAGIERDPPCAEPAN